MGFTLQIWLPDFLLIFWAFCLKLGRNTADSWENIWHKNHLENCFTFREIERQSWKVHPDGLKGISVSFWTTDARKVLLIWNLVRMCKYFFAFFFHNSNVWIFRNIFLKESPAKSWIGISLYYSLFWHFKVCRTCIISLKGSSNILKCLKGLLRHFYKSSQLTF